MKAIELLEKDKCLLNLREYCPFKEIQIRNLKRYDVKSFYRLCALCIKAEYAKTRDNRISVVNTL